jgi:hypothetical protein
MSTQTNPRQRTQCSSPKIKWKTCTDFNNATIVNDDENIFSLELNFKSPSQSEIHNL